ncbi:hypothetical protein [Bacillus tuaregi]|uniref:hypothetical protein n=1 Tax=Bacillus tuaregi TaxID=1816695 RepID=UPI0008F80327|nr:hypothetical protein [Bacillus tuaregi]
MNIIFAVLLFAITCGILSVNIPAGIAVILLTLSVTAPYIIKEYNNKIRVQRRRAQFRVVK